MAETLTKAKLAELLHNRVGVTKKEAGSLVDEVFGLMRDRLIDGEKVKERENGGHASLRRFLSRLAGHDG